MKKIYNNLSIDNLRKTEWFNQFDVFQQKEIIKGLNVSVYAKKELDSQQMAQIRYGLDVSIYDKDYFNSYQMEEIRVG